MSSSATPPTPAAETQPALARRIRAAMEGLILVLVCLTPWAFGCVHPGFEFLLYAGLALLLCLWGLNILLTGQRPWDFCPVALCLAGLVLLGLCQLVPLSRPVLDFVSPGTAAWYDRLLPAEPETFEDGKPASKSIRAGATISLDPATTRAEVIRLLAVFALFLLVRQNLASPAALRRLCLVALTNGALLALFAVVQHWTARYQTVYWVLPTIGAPFGPFITRNHAAGYFNLCLGLGLGYFLSQGRRGTTSTTRQGGLDASLLWMLLPLTILLVGVAFSQSRGGLLAFFGAAGVCLLIQIAQGRRVRLFSGLLAVGCLAFALLAWFGLGRVTERLNTAIEQGEPSRIRAWSRVLPLVQDFPLWGTGYGTFGSVELTQRVNTLDQGIIYSHAHNEYVEALLEGGLLRLLLTVGAIALISRAAFRVVRGKADSLGADLALGGIFAIAALALHSIVEFSVHIPALTFLMTVLCAQLSGMAATANADKTPHEAPAPTGLARGGAVLVVLGIAFVVVAQGWKAYRVDRLQSAPPGATSAERIRRLESAVRLAPDDAVLHFELAQARLKALEEPKRLIVRRVLVCEAVQTVLAFAPTGDVAQGHPALLGMPRLLGTIEGREHVLRAESAPFHAEVTQALRHAVDARNANPLLIGPHLELAARGHELARADSPLVYLERAKWLAPADPQIWYLSGLRALTLLRLDQTCADWHRSLELSNQHLVEILNVAKPIFPPRVIRTKILTDNPTQLLAAAQHLFSETQQEERRPFLEEALVLLEKMPDPHTAEDLHVEAVVRASLQQPDKALAAYQAALMQEPRRVEWRFEYAALLREQKRLPEARLELLTILNYQPTHAAARELLPIWSREIAEKK